MFTLFIYTHASIKCNVLNLGKGKLDENKTKQKRKQIMMHFTNDELLNLRIKAFRGVSSRYFI